MNDLAEAVYASSEALNCVPTFRNRMYRIMTTFHVKGAKLAMSHYYSRTLELVTNRDKSAPESKPDINPRFANERPDATVAELSIRGPNSRWGLPYEASKEEVFYQRVGSLPVRPETYHFIDLGAGKGIALLFASKLSFKNITGVEYSRKLANAATENIQEYQEQCGSAHNIRCIWGDAAEFELPEEPTVLYLNNPFQGKVMDRVIANIESSLRRAPRDLWVIYGYPWEARKFRRSAYFDTIESNLDYSIHRSRRG
jgi:predicted RNA methylase